MVFYGHLVVIRQLKYMYDGSSVYHGTTCHISSTGVMRDKMIKKEYTWYKAKAF